MAVPVVGVPLVLVKDELGRWWWRFDYRAQHIDDEGACASGRHPDGAPARCWWITRCKEGATMHVVLRHEPHVPVAGPLGVSRDVDEDRLQVQAPPLDLGSAGVVGSEHGWHQNPIWA
jgi:hypothetical protein